MEGSVELTVHPSLCILMGNPMTDQYNFVRLSLAGDPLRIQGDIDVTHG